MILRVCVHVRARGLIFVQKLLIGSFFLFHLLLWRHLKRSLLVGVAVDGPAIMLHVIIHRGHWDKEITLPRNPGASKSTKACPSVPCTMIHFSLALCERKQPQGKRGTAAIAARFDIALAPVFLAPPLHNTFRRIAFIVEGVSHSNQVT